MDFGCFAFSFKCLNHFKKKILLLMILENKKFEKLYFFLFSCRVCMYMGAFVYAYEYMFRFMYVCICLDVYMCLWEYVYVSMCKFWCVYMYILYVCIYIYLYVCMYVCLSVCLRVFASPHFLGTSSIPNDCDHSSQAYLDTHLQIIYANSLQLSLRCNAEPATLKFPLLVLVH